MTVLGERVSRQLKGWERTRVVRDGDLRCLGAAGNLGESWAEVPESIRGPLWPPFPPICEALSNPHLVSVAIPGLYLSIYTLPATCVRACV